MPNNACEKKELDNNIVSNAKGECESLTDKIVDMVSATEDLSVVPKTTIIGNRGTSPLIDNANKKVLIEVLSPEISANERKKRKHKDILLLGVAVFLTIQFTMLFILTYNVINSIIVVHVAKNPMKDSTIQILINFVIAYMTSIVVELIAMLNYIVKHVFDTSISSLVKAFGLKTPKKDSSDEKKNKV